METDGTSARTAPAYTGLAAALAFAAKGIPVFPLVPRTKKPATPNGFYDATTNETTIRAWWQRNPRFNIGIPTGSATPNAQGWHAAGWVVVDIDPREGGSLDDLINQRGPVPPTLTARTGSMGWHLIFRHPGGVVPTSKALGKGYDIKSDGGYIMVAPSIHPNGNAYTWIDPNTEPAAMPGWLVRAIAAAELPKREERGNAEHDPRENGEQRPSDGRYWLERALARVAEMGQRDNNGLWLAQQLLWNEVLDPEDIMLAYADAVPIVPGDPYTGKDAIRNLSSARKQGKRGPARSQSLPLARPERKQKKPALHLVPPPDDDGGEDDDPPPGPPGQPSEAKRYPLTEMGNAERLLDAYGANLRYNKALDFIVYDGQRWCPESALRVRQWAKATVRAMYREASDYATQAAKATDDGERQRLAADAEALSAWARKSETARMVDAMLKLVMADCYVDVSVFDVQPWLFNCANGTLDLRTGELREHRRDDYLMQWSPAAYEPRATCPRYAKFVSQIMLDRQPLVDYLQRALGYALTGHVGEQVWHLLHGEGENGKSTLMEIIEHIMGDYAATLEPETITAGSVKRDGGAPSPDIAKLKGKRFVKITETEEGDRIAPARIKKLSGGDKLSARFLNRDLFEFQPTFKLFIYTNHKPQTREMTHAFWRRVRLVPFEWNVSLLPAGEEKDPDLKDKIIAEEAPGVLAWLVRGCLAWQREGLNPPPEVAEATDKYKGDMDVLGKFLEECCIVGTPYQVRAKALWTAWKEWCEENNEREGTQRSFGMALGKRPEGFTKDHRRDGDWWYGLEVVSDRA